MTKLSSRLPDNDSMRNGLDDDVNQDAIRYSDAVRYVVAAVSTSFTKRSYKGGPADRPTSWAEEATLGIEAIEVLEGEEAEQARQVLENRFSRRTGQPINGPVEVFKVDQDTGEIIPGDIDVDFNAENKVLTFSKTHN